MNSRESDDYKKWRASVKMRDGRKCQFPNCKKRTKLEVHHILPWSLSASLRFEVSNGICLCSYHHKSIKGKEGYYTGMFQAIVNSKTQKKKK